MGHTTGLAWRAGVCASVSGRVCVRAVRRIRLHGCMRCACGGTYGMEPVFAVQQAPFEAALLVINSIKEYCFKPVDGDATHDPSRAALNLNKNLLLVNWKVEFARLIKGICVCQAGVEWHAAGLQTAASCCSLLHWTFHEMKFCALNSPPRQPIADRLALLSHQSRSCC